MINRKPGSAPPSAAEKGSELIGTELDEYVLPDIDPDDILDEVKIEIMIKLIIPN